MKIDLVVPDWFNSKVEILLALSGSDSEIDRVNLKVPTSRSRSRFWSKYLKLGFRL